MLCAEVMLIRVRGEQVPGHHYNTSTDLARVQGVVSSD